MIVSNIIKLTKNKLEIYEKNFETHSLPSWEELPEIGLYMDQVIILMNKYLGLFYGEGMGDKFITPSIINNYVKLKVIPSPVKKKYSRTHLAFIIMVCILKQCLNISVIQRIIPVDFTEDELKAFYDTFRQYEKRITDENTARIKDAYLKKEASEKDFNSIMRELALESALSANIFKIFTDIFTPPEKK